MAVLVLKFGGTSVANTNRLKIVAQKIIEEHKAGNKIVVVVSAMAGATNQLIEYCSEVSSLDKKLSLSEYDVVVSTGEVMTSALLALALQQTGIKSQSFQAWQLPILTNNVHRKALIEHIDIKSIQNCFNENIIPIIAGFSGITKEYRLTTLGRGGSDTTAVAVAAALNADRCDIYTDVEGVYSADPRIVQNAKLLLNLSYSNMLAMASCGAKVLHYRSIKIAAKYGVPIKVLSSFTDKSNESKNIHLPTYSLISNESKNMEIAKVLSIAYNNVIALVEIDNIKSYNEEFIPIYNELSAIDVHIESLQHIFDHHKGTNKYTFTVALADISKIIEIKYKLESIQSSITLNYNSDIVMISLIGNELTNNLKNLSKMISIINDEKLQIFHSNFSTNVISVIINNKSIDRIVKMLHLEFIEN